MTVGVLLDLDDTLIDRQASIRAYPERFFQEFGGTLHLEACRRIGAEPTESWFVGDHPAVDVAVDFILDRHGH